jgi:uncharacterized membrane protein YebE (DUF533 family)
MMDARGILDQLFQSGKEMLDKGRNVAEQKLGMPEGGEKREAMVSGLGKGAAIGGLLALLVGTKGGRQVSGKVIKYGSIAAVATAAYKAYQSWAGQSASAGSIEPSQGRGELSQGTGEPGKGKGQSMNEIQDSSAQQQRALLLVRAMIAAANADGHIDDQEKQTIQGKLAELQISPESIAKLQSELASPLTPEQLGSMVDSQAAASEVYLLTSLVIDEQSDVERRYLDRLATALRLPTTLTSRLEKEAFA